MSFALIAPRKRVNAAQGNGNVILLSIPSIKFIVFPRCHDPVNRIEQSAVGTVFICTYGGTKHGVSGCHRTYLSQRDLQAHIDHRHLRDRGEKKSNAGASPAISSTQPAALPQETFVSLPSSMHQPPPMQPQLTSMAPGGTDPNMLFLHSRPDPMHMPGAPPSGLPPTNVPPPLHGLPPQQQPSPGQPVHSMGLPQTHLPPPPVAVSSHMDTYARNTNLITVPIQDEGDFHYARSPGQQPFGPAGGPQRFPQGPPPFSGPPPGHPGSFPAGAPPNMSRPPGPPPVRGPLLPGPPMGGPPPNFSPGHRLPFDQSASPGQRTWPGGPSGPPPPMGGMPRGPPTTQAGMGPPHPFYQ